jgi:hypothetical protein
MLTNMRVMHANFCEYQFDLFRGRPEDEEIRIRRNVKKAPQVIKLSSL